MTYGGVNYNYHVVCYIPSTYNVKSVPFVPSSNSPSPIPASGNHISDLFFYEFICF